MSIQEKKGFTLIELLVVIAIIGILSSIVLTSVNSARAKAADAAMKENVYNIHAQAAVYYDDNLNMYTNLCTSGVQNVAALVAAATTAGSASVTCADSDAAWAVQAQLKTSTNYYCIDSTGAATTTATSTIADGSDYVCG